MPLLDEDLIPEKGQKKISKTEILVKGIFIVSALLLLFSPLALLILEEESEHYVLEIMISSGLVFFITIVSNGIFTKYHLEKKTEHKIMLFQNSIKGKKTSIPNLFCQ
jgi:hypothetical protein